MWKLTIEDDEGKQTALPLAHEEYGLGRGESNAIRLTDRNISRTHAILKKTSEVWSLKDLQSYNGTFVNGVRVVGEQALGTGDLVQIGDYRLELVDDATLPVAAVPGAPPAPAPAHQRPNRLVVVVGPTPGAEFPLDKDSFTIGRSEEATISINHSSVSRVHAELIPIGNGRFEIVDKASANGIRINGVELKRGILEAGDALELGDVRMRFVGAGKIFRTGTDQSHQLAPGGFDNGVPSMVSPTSAKPGLGMGKLVGLGVGVGVVVIAAIVMLTRPPSGQAQGPLKPDSAHTTAEGAELLVQAKEKLAAKDIDGAHQKIQEIPENSTVRDDPAVKDVEGAWADSMFAKVEQAPDSAAKKVLLHTVSATPTVDAERRKKAADLVREIEAKEPPPVPTYTGGGEFPRPNGTGATVASAAPTAGPATGGGSSIPSGLAAEDAQRKALEPKVFGGRGTVDDIRMLKAICSHLGNRDCRDRASALLKKKLESQPYVAGEAPPPEPASRLAGNGLTSSALAASVTLLALIGAAYVVPGLARFRVLTPLPEGAALAITKPVVAGDAPMASVGEAQLGVETHDDTPKTDEVAIPPAAIAALPSVREDKKAPRPIEDPSGHALDPLFAALHAAEQKKGIARITYFGDSIVASDFVTGTLRRRLQRRFGDAGHGFMLMANAWPGYSHNDVVRFAAPGWQVSRVVGPFAKDGFYGLGGVSFRSEGPGVFSRFATTKSGTFGRAVAKFVVDYLEQPKGGALEIKVDGQTRETIDTSGPASKSAIRTYAVPDGEHELEVRATSANARAFGVWMERDEPGVVLDAIGIQGCRIRFLDQSDDAHFAEQLKLRDPALTVFEYGMNESEDGELYPLDHYEATMKAVLAQVKAALPRAACLLVGPLDRVDKRGDTFHSRPVIPKLAAIQRKVAGEVGCAYWDTFTAMGGAGSMGTWFQRGLGGADFAHPSSAGAEVLGNWVYLALMQAYEESSAQPAPH